MTDVIVNTINGIFKAKSKITRTSKPGVRPIIVILVINQT